MSDTETSSKVCPKCGSTKLTSHDKLEVTYGANGFSGDLHIEFCTDCGFVYDKGTWLEK